MIPQHRAETKAVYFHFIKSAPTNKATAMTAIVEKDFDRNLRPRERHRGFPKLALRQRSSDHPMIMFFIIVMTAFAAMTLVPPSGAAFASFAISSTAASPAKTEPVANVGLSDIEIACQGQAWGAESAECLAKIAKDSGRPDGRKVRVIAGV
jgi:hypothetical protein